MAGRARTTALKERLQALANEYFENDYVNGDEPRGTLDYVCDRVESGDTIKELAASLSADLAHEVTHARIMAVLREEHGTATVEERLAASRVRASHSLAETALELVDAPADSNVDVSRAASRARTRQWMAERYNQREFGSQKGVSVHITTGSLHLDALRATSRIVTGASEGALNAASAEPALLPANRVSVVEP